MYNNLSKTRRGRPWLLLAALFAWLLPQTAAAEQFIHDPDNYSVSLGGTNIIYFKAPVYDQKNVDQWVSDAYLMVSVDGGPKMPVLHWYAAGEISSSATEANAWFSALQDVFFDITLGNTTKTVRLPGHTTANHNVKRNSDGYSFTFEAEWVVPYDLLGKKLTFTWDVERYGNNIAWERVKVDGLKTVTINMPAASAKLTPFLSSPMMDPNTPGKLQLPWFLASDSITKAWYEYDDATGQHHKEELSNLSNGIIMLDANVPHKSLRVLCNYKEKGDKGSYEIQGVASSPQSVPLIHGPVGLVARPLDERSRRWN